MNTKELIYSMLTESTGAHMLDSGGAYGRHWERNQKRSIEDFENEPEQLYTWDGHYICRTVSVFHYLSQLEQDELCEEFNALPCPNWDAEEVYGVSDSQWRWLCWQANVRLSDLSVKHTFNTYNWDSDLSQVLHGSWIDIGGQQYLLLQIHNGCDVRGGYTDAKLFVPVDDGIIHEYLDDYQDSYVINEYLEGGHITVIDYYDPTIKYTSEEILKLMK
jgi:hypothetical protein